MLFLCLRTHAGCNQVGSIFDLESSSSICWHFLDQKINRSKTLSADYLMVKITVSFSSEGEKWLKTTQRRHGKRWNHQSGRPVWLKPLTPQEPANQDPCPTGKTTALPTHPPTQPSSHDILSRGLFVFICFSPSLFSSTQLSLLHSLHLSLNFYQIVPLFFVSCPPSAPCI